MKLISKILLLIFFTFLVTPAVVAVIEKSADISIFYSMTEEEHVHKDMKTFCYSDPASVLLISTKLSSGVILSENLSKHDNIASSIFIPPPDQV